MVFLFLFCSLTLNLLCTLNIPPTPPPPFFFSFFLFFLSHSVSFCARGSERGRKMAIILGKSCTGKWKEGSIAGQDGLGRFI